MKKRDNYRIERLRAAKCGKDEISALFELHSNFFAGKANRAPSVTDLKMACRRNHVFVIRQRSAGEPIVGVLIFVIVHLFDGPIGMIECPSMLTGHERLSEPLIARAIKYASDQGIELILVSHRVLGVNWQIKEALLNLGFSPIGARVHSLKVDE